jgi:hypothetical protein
MSCSTCFDTHTSFAPTLACWRRVTPDPVALAGSASERPVSALRGRTLQPIDRDGRAPARRPGRPRVGASAQRRKAADRAREYRQRQRAAQAAANGALLAGEAP